MMAMLVLRTSDISEHGRVNTATPPRLRLAATDFAKYRVERGDLLITRTGSLGTLAVFDDDVDAMPGAYLIQYRLKAPIDTSWFVFHYLKSRAGQKRLLAGGRGIGRPNLNAPSIESIPIPLASLDEQQSIVSEIDRRLSDAAALDALIFRDLKHAERLRQAILKRAFDGRLVSQDPTDEPAVVSLERILAEGASSNGTIRRRLTRPRLKPANPPVQAPLPI